MDKLAQDRMMGALKTGKKPKKLPLDKEDLGEMAKVGKKKFILNEKDDIKKAGK
jgi:hypothetical protein